MILVTGATGNVGGAVIRQLLTRRPEDRIVGFVHDRSKAAALDAQGVIVRAGDYDDPATLRAAMRGVETVLLVSGSNEERGLQQHRNVVNAAAASGVRTIAYTGRSLKDRNTLINRLMVRHFETEDYIKESGLEHLLFRNSLYMDTLPAFVGAVALDSGLRLPAGDGRAAFALRREQGEAIANALAAHQGGSRTYLLTGSEAWSYHDVGAALGELAGKSVGYTPIEPEAYVAELKDRGVPAPVADKLLAFQIDIRKGQEEQIAPDLQALLGRPPTSLRDGLKELFDL